MAAAKNALRSKKKLMYPAPAVSTRATPGISRERQFPRDFLRDLPWRAPQPLGQLKGHRRRRLAHGDLGRTLDHHGNIFDAPLPQNFSQRRTYASFNDVIHEFSAPDFEAIGNKGDSRL